MADRKVVVLANIEVFGHHETYMKYFTKALLELGHQVWVFFPEPDLIQTWINENCPSTAHHVTYRKIHHVKYSHPIFYKTPLKYFFIYYHPLSFVFGLTNFWILSKKLKKEFKDQSRPDLVYFTWLTEYLNVSSFSFLKQIQRIFLRPKLLKFLFPYTWAGFYNYSLKGEHQILKTPHLKSLSVFWENESGSLARELQKPVFIAPDFADDSLPTAPYSIAEEIRSKAAGRKIITLVGVLFRRKGFLTLLKTAEQPQAKDWFFVFAGEIKWRSFTSKERAYIKSFFSTNNCYFYPHYLPDESSLNTIIELCDILFAAYLDFPDSSNMLVKAAIFQKPLIVSKGFYMEKMTKQYNLGKSIEQDNEEECGEAIRQLFLEKNVNRRYDAFKKINSPVQLNKMFEKILLEL